MISSALPKASEQKHHVSQIEAIKALNDKKLASNPFVSNNAVEDEKILGEISTKLRGKGGVTDDTFFWGTGHPADNILSYATKGITITNKEGKKETFKVPPRLLKIAVDQSAIEDKNWIYNNTDTNVLNKVKELIAKPEYKDHLAEADLLRNNNQLVAELSNYSKNNIRDDSLESWSKLLAQRETANTFNRLRENEVLNGKK